MSHSIVTMKEILIGFGIAVGSALVSAVLITQFRTVERVLFPLLILTQTIPKVAMAPLLIVWFGIGISSKVLTVALIAFFPSSSTPSWDSGPPPTSRSRCSGPSARPACR